MASVDLIVTQDRLGYVEFWESNHPPRMSNTDRLWTSRWGPLSLDDILINGVLLDGLNLDKPQRVRLTIEPVESEEGK